MKELANAIFTLFKAKVPGATELYNTIALPSAVFPYVVMRIITGTGGGTLTEDQEDVLIQFNIYSDDPSSEAVCDIFQEISDAFNEPDDEDELDIENYKVVSMTRHDEPYMLNRWEEKGIFVWDLMSQFRIIVSKT